MTLMIFHFKIFYAQLYKLNNITRRSNTSLCII